MMAEAPPPPLQIEAQPTEAHGNEVDKHLEPVFTRDRNDLELVGENEQPVGDEDIDL